MKIVQGNQFLGKPETQISGNSIRFVADDGRTILEVCIKDPRTVEVRGVSTYKIGDKLYTEQLIIEPRVSNCIWISTKEY